MFALVINRQITSGYLGHFDLVAHGSKVKRGEPNVIVNPLIGVGLGKQQGHDL